MSKSRSRGAPAGRRAPHRDRHGRGLRGSLVPSGVPLARSGAELFDELVLDAVEHLDDRWGAQLAEVEFAVEDVPPLPEQPPPEGPLIPLARVVPAGERRPARIVVFRRPIEARAADREELADLVHDVVVEHVAELLGLEPETVDPGYAGGGWDDG
ncbi:MAG: metallopeptidase family protein [Actinomycetes bacterium]